MRLYRDGPPEGRRVLLLHGSQGHAGVWLPVLPAFHAAGFATFRLDQRGHGASARVARYTVDDYVQDLLAVLDEVGPCAVVGHSMGGLNAFVATARRPDLVTALVHVDIDPAPAQWQADYLHDAGGRPPRAYDTAGQAMTHLLPRLAPLADPGRVGPAILAGLDRTPEGKFTLAYDPATLRDWGPYDLRPVLPLLDLPVLIVRGAETNVMTEAGQADLRKGLRRVDVAVVPGGHHCFWDAPDAFAAAVVNFLTRPETGIS